MEAKSDALPENVVDMNTRERFQEIINSLKAEDGGPENTRKIYSEWATKYDKDLAAHAIYGCPAACAKELASRLGGQKDARILDLGAGTGLVAMELSKHGFTNIDAFDASPEMLQIAKQKSLYKQYIRGYLGAEPISIENDVYDALVSAGAFTPNHVDDSCFEELIRITKPGGMMVFVVLQEHIENRAQFQTFEPKIKQLESAGHWTLLNPGDSREGVWGINERVMVYVLRKQSRESI